MKKRELRVAALAMGAALCVPPMGVAQASSHREAPFITKNPKTDASDFYMFNSYEGGRAGYVTILANYEPLQDPAGGPNFYQLDPNALYEISIDNNGDAKEDVTFQFRFANALNGGTGLTVPVGGMNTAIPLINDGPIAVATLNETETYSVTMVKGDRRTGTPSTINQTGTPTATTFTKPVDFIGASSFGAAQGAAAVTAYNNYVAPYMYYVDIPGCTPPGTASATNHPRVFVGQRQEGFAVNLGTIFDLLGAVPSPGALGTLKNGTNRANRGNTDTTNNSLAQGANSLGNKNVTTIALEVPASCLTATTTPTGNATIIGGWTTASVRQARVINPTGSFTEPSRDGGAWAQISRLGNPLVNEVVIGLKDKDLFNSSAPSDDTQFANYVEYPSLPVLVNALYSAAAGGAQLAPQTYPRTDLVAAFLTGVSAVDMGTGSTHGQTVNVNKNGSTAEYLRLNTAFTATPRGMQSSLGAAACFVGGALTLSNTDGTVDGTCDPNGFPNGRRPGDDVVDIAIRVEMGYLLPAGTNNNAGGIPFTDYAINYDTQFGMGFPYLNTPYPGE